MQLQILCIPALFLCMTYAQRMVEVERDDGSYSIGVESNSIGGTGDSVAALLTKASGWTAQTGRAGLNADVNLEVPHFLSTGLQITRQLPYVEILRLVEAFLKLKGELASRFWSLFYDNAHILTAVRDTLISKISTLHNLTLSAIVIIRKVFEFASYLFSGASVNVNSSGPLLRAGATFG